MTFVTITSKGQMTLPKEIRDDLKVGPGDRLIVEKQDGVYVLLAQRSALDLAGILKRPNQKPVSIEEMDGAIMEEAWERNRPKHDRD